MKAILMLEDGKSFIGQADSCVECIGEIIINTAVVGYQEMITDPVNVGKILVLTYPLIGNYGCASQFTASSRVWVAGLVIKEKSRVFSNWQAKGSLDNFLKQHKKPVIYDLDTRTLTLYLREKGPLFGIISTNEFNPQKLMGKISLFKRQPATSFFAQTSTPRVRKAGKPKGRRVAVLDLGMSSGFSRQLEAAHFALTVLPYDAQAKDILKIKPRGLIISDGPENDFALTQVAQNILPLIGKLPVLGVACGCQVLAKALGAQLARLKLGHRGSNYPIARPGTFKGEITVQNHGYVIEANSLRKIKEVKVTAYNLNDHTIEEIESKKLKLTGVQYSLISPGFNMVHPVLIKFSQLLGR